jgi:hypothetical protein
MIYFHIEMIYGHCLPVRLSPYARERAQHLQLEPASLLRL